MTCGVLCMLDFKLILAILCVFICLGIPWGMAADRYGRKICLVLSMLNVAVLGVGFGFSSSFYMAVLFRFLIGEFSHVTSHVHISYTHNTHFAQYTRPGQWFHGHRQDGGDGNHALQEARNPGFWDHQRDLGTRFVVIHHTPYTIHHPPYTIHHIPYTIYHIPYTIHHVPYTIYHTPYTIYHTPYTIYHIPYTLYPIPYTIHHTPYTIYHTPYTIYHIPYTIYHIPYT
ncbi:hypothetical protein EON63_14120, partial [archaeon]